MGGRWGWGGREGVGGMDGVIEGGRERWAGKQRQEPRREEWADKQSGSEVRGRGTETDRQTDRDREI